MQVSILSNITVSLRRFANFVIIYAVFANLCIPYVATVRYIAQAIIDHVISGSTSSDLVDIVVLRIEVYVWL